MNVSHEQEQTSADGDDVAIGLLSSALFNGWKQIKKHRFGKAFKKQTFVPDF